MERDHLTRLVYRELLDVLHARGGYLHRDEVSGACLVSREEAEHAVARLLPTGRLKETEDGRLFNPRILESLAEEAKFRDQNRQLASSGGKALAGRMTSEERSQSARHAAERRWTDARSMRADSTHDARTSTHDACPPTPTPTPTPEEEEEDAPDGAAPDGAPRQPIRREPSEPEGFEGRKTDLRLANLLGAHDAQPPPERDERVGWLRALLPEIEAAADAETPDGDSTRQRSARVKRIALARWRVYLRGERIYRGAAERERTDSFVRSLRDAEAREPLVQDPELRELPFSLTTIRAGRASRASR
jgi:hypothetical protein